MMPQSITARNDGAPVTLSPAAAARLALARRALRRLAAQVAAAPPHVHTITLPRSDIAMSLALVIADLPPLDEPAAGYIRTETEGAR